MKDLEVHLPDRPGALGSMAATLGAAAVSLEGGGVFVTDGVGVAHFLIADDDAERAARALRDVEITVNGVRDVVLTRLRQDVPGQLGALCRRLAEAGVNITTQYSDHDGRLVLLTDDPSTARLVVQDRGRSER